MGEMTEAELEAIREEAAGSEDTDILAGTHEIAAAMAAGAGDSRRAHDEYLAMADASSLNAPYLLPLAAIQAVLAGDAALARAALARLREIGTRGRAVDANRLGIEAGITALDGERRDHPRRLASPCGQDPRRASRACTASRWHRRRDVAVQVQSDANLAMPEHLAGYLWVNALHQHERGRCMAEVVEPDAREFCFGQQGPEGPT